MTIDFDFQNVTLTEFGIGRDVDDAQTFVLVPVDASVQVALQEMAIATRDEMARIAEPNPPVYEPSERYESCQYIHLPLKDEMAKQMRFLQQAKNLPSSATILDDPSDVFCYFARMIDGKNRHLTGLRRATQFKGVLTSRLIRFMTDALKIIKDKVFKLDSNFDLLIVANDVHILRPSGFEFVSKLQDAILAAAPANIKQIQRDMPFVDFAPIEEYASKHPRAARHLASIRALKETKNIDKTCLKRLCKKTGVEIQEVNGKISVTEGNLMDFLEVLDRRRYEVELIKDLPESFRAASRRKITNVGGQAGT